MINVGFVYCRHCATHGPAHRVIADVPRRVLQLLMGRTLYKTRNGHSSLAEMVLWEQDLFKDAIEHVAFGLPAEQSRHALSNADVERPAERREANAGARSRRWQFENVRPQPGLPAAPFPWLALPSDVGGGASKGGAGIGEENGGHTLDESLSALPLWVFSPWNVPPHGAACAGQWARRPASPVMIGHLVGCTSKHFTFRQLGWWHYDVSAVDAVDAVEEAARASRSQRAPPSVTSAAASPRRVFPRGARLLVLDRIGLDVGVAESVFAAWNVLRRFALLALTLGRRAVQPDLGPNLTLSLASL